MARQKDALKVPNPYAPALRHLYVASAHLALFALSFWLAYGLRYEFQIPPAVAPIPDTEMVLPGDVGVPESVWNAFYELLFFVCLVKVIVFGYFRLYAGWWQYVSVQDLVETFKASHVSTAIILVAVYVDKALLAAGVKGVPDLPVPDTILIIDWAATIALVGGLRFMVRIVREGSRPVSPAGLIRTLIIGAG
ncbi:MAG TPA: hypothetical protein VMY35_17810, partial [Phycisphaerae bacterium]|nr:hypothetical protein [Phycisphaerae bacterium]